ncbi:MAG: glycosyl hydrolase [Planctomycetota bacterium]|nr:glycosyl hydrolase [Planctomycetota bacterium]
MRHFKSEFRNLITAAILCVAAAAAVTPPLEAVEIKVLLCTGDYGMWAQDRAALIQAAVHKAAEGKAVFEVEQSFNFVKKLEAPGFAERFDVIVCGDIALGQITTRAQQALIRFAKGGGGLIYVVWAKSFVPFYGSREAEPLPLADVLPYKYPNSDPLKDAHDDARALNHTDALFNGLDFSKTLLVAPDKNGNAPDPLPPLALERPLGKGKVMALYVAFGASYKYISYAKHEYVPGGWDTWPGFGKLWTKLLQYASTGSPGLDKSREQIDALIKEVPCEANVEIDATKTVDDVRAANFSIVALQQLYNEDGGAGEEEFLALNPQDWFDRRTQEVLPSTKGKFPDKPAMFRQYNIRGIMMGNNSYGSYGGWSEETWTKEVNSYVEAAKKYPDILSFFQPGNEPPSNQGYYDFHNRISDAVLKEAPHMKVIGPGVAWNCHGANEKDLREFIEKCGAKTDVLNWHIYARCPSSVRDVVGYWAKEAEGKLRSKGPVRVMFTEADAWNTRDSQFNYLLDRAFTFLPMKEIIACFQYCMRPRYEGGTYWFGVLMNPAPGHVKPAGEFTANYNGFWIFRNLRGRLVETKAAITPAEARENCRVLASSNGDGKTVTLVAYYDTGYFNGREKSSQASVKVKVKLPPGRYKLERSESNWGTFNATSGDGTVEGGTSVEFVLDSCHATALTWTRQ